MSFTLRLVLYPYCRRVLFDGEGSPTSILRQTSFVSLQSYFRGQTLTKCFRYWTFQYAPGSSVDQISSPSRVYIVRTVFSAIPGALYLVCMVILGSSRLITGPEAQDSYQTIYLVCLALIVLSFAVSAQQFVSTGVASWYTKGWTKG